MTVLDSSGCLWHDRAWGDPDRGRSTAGQLSVVHTPQNGERIYFTATNDRGERISDALVTFVEERLPGFEELIEYRELATPITTEHFTNHRNGNIYGLPSIPEKFKAIWLGPYTPIRNLYLTGSDVWFFGIVGSMMSGVLATAVAMRRPWKVVKIMSEAIRYSRQLHSRPSSVTQAKI